MRRAPLGLGLALVLVLAASAPPATATATAAATTPEDTVGSDPPPVLAHYYIWFNPTSWQRAKTDEPLLGPYSSDEVRVMERHVEWAQAAGIDAFVVSWKSTEPLDRRLDQLVEVARARDFQLAITYQALDFEREPLPVDRIERDLLAFADQYGEDPVFDVFDVPVVIWTGTWEYTSEEVARVHAALDGRVLLLASERNVEGIERLRGVVDGDAYYWSSVDPTTYPDTAAKLTDMAAAVREDGGLWIAPVAPGFDARLVGGTSVVERAGGDTLRARWSAALASSPDAIGLISWNEFSENTHVEPSVNFGSSYLDDVAALTGTEPPGIRDDSEAVPTTDHGSLQPFVLAAVLVGGMTLSAFRIRRREQR